MQSVTLHSVYLTACLVASLNYCARVSPSLSLKLSHPSCLVAELPDHTPILPAR